MNADERLLQYQQEFKRYSKLRQDADERPVNIHVANLKDATQSMLNSLGSAAATTKQTTAKKTPLLRKKQPPPLKGKKNKLALHKKAQSIGTPPSVVPASANNSSGSEFETAFDEVESEMGSPETSGQSDDDAGLSAAEATTSAASNKTPRHSTRHRRQPAPPHIPVDTQKRRAQVLNYVQKYPDRLGLDQNMQVMRLMAGGEYRAIRGSNVEKFLDYHFSSHGNIGTRGGTKSKQPPGYRSFITSAKRDPYLAPRLFDVDAQAMTPKTGRGCRKGKKNGLIEDLRIKTKKNRDGKMVNYADDIKPTAFGCYIKKPFPFHPSNLFKFKPKLW